MLFNSIKGGTTTWRRERSREQSAVGCLGCNPRETSSTVDSRGKVAKNSYHQVISAIGEVRVHGQVYRVPACEIGIERVQIAQDRIVETAPLEARTGERDSVPEPARRKVRFPERVDERNT